MDGRPARELSPVQLMDQLEATLRKAREALADEYEGGLVLAAAQLQYDATRLVALLEAW